MTDLGGTTIATKKQTKKILWFFTREPECTGLFFEARVGRESGGGDKGELDNLNIDHSAIKDKEL